MMSKLPTCVYSVKRLQEWESHQGISEKRVALICESSCSKKSGSTTRMVIRHVTPADSSAWERMREALWPGDAHAAEIAAFFAGTLSEPEAVIVAELPPGTLVAVMELSIRRDLLATNGAPTGYVEGLYVEPPHRAFGIARQLLRAAQQWARQRRCTFFASDRDDRIIIDRNYHHDTRDA